METFIRELKATANQLGHGNGSILKLIKAYMPTAIYGTLYSITDLADLIKMVKDIFAMKPDTSKTTAMTSTTPFSTKESGIKLPEIHGISKILNAHKRPEHQKLVPIFPQKSYPNPMVKSIIRKPSSIQIAKRNLIKKSAKQLHNNPKPIKQTKITPFNNIYSQMNDDATLTPTSNTHIQEDPNKD